MVLSTILERNPELRHKQCINLDEVFSVGMDEWMDGWVGGWMDHEWMGEWIMNGWMDEWIYSLYFSVVAVSFLYVRERY